MLIVVMLGGGGTQKNGTQNFFSFQRHTKMIHKINQFIDFFLYRWSNADWLHYKIFLYLLQAKYWTRLFFVILLLWSVFLFFFAFLNLYRCIEEFNPSSAYKSVTRTFLGIYLSSFLSMRMKQKLRTNQKRIRCVS